MTTLNLKPIEPPVPLFKYTCVSCLGAFPTAVNFKSNGFADLNGKPFEAYYCPQCAKALIKQRITMLQKELHINPSS